MYNSFYNLKPLIPRQIQLFLRRRIIHYKLASYKNIWPIDQDAVRLPDNWQGWPEQKQFALVLTHDVEFTEGQEKCYDLMELEKTFGFRSSFNFVPKRYTTSPKLRNRLISDGFEIGVHGLYHDGKLYESKETFQRRATQINHYLEEWNAVGFRSPAMHHNLDWIYDLQIEYDLSTFDTDPFEPQSDGVKTIFPFWVPDRDTQNGYVELPYTLPQDHLLFVLMKEGSIDVWKKKLCWIVENGGMALLNTHPDYMNFKNGRLNIEEYPAVLYYQFLEYVKTTYDGLYWHALPRDVARYVSTTVVQ